MTSRLQTHAHYITIGDTRLPLIATQHPRARRLIVRYDATSRCVRLTLPRRVSMRAAIQFAESKADWIAQQMHHAKPLLLADGVTLPLWGGAVTLCHAPGRGVAHLEGHRLIVPGDATFLPRRAEDFIRRETHARIRQLAQSYATQLGVTVTAIRLRDTRSRWGSCSHGGRLSFCWRLAYAPLAVMDYVVCHEVCHLAHHHHGDAFWAAVATLCPDFQQHETWLATHGRTLWRYVIG